MRGFRKNTVSTLLVLSAALFLRAVAPAGYMPSSGSGLLFELCPEGVSAEFMAMLSGSNGHDHSNHHESGGGDDCSMGHLLLSAAAVDDSSGTELAPTLPIYTTVPRYAFTSASRTHYHSRGPPA